MTAPRDATTARAAPGLAGLAMLALPVLAAPAAHLGAAAGIACAGVAPLLVSLAGPRGPGSARVAVGAQFASSAATFAAVLAVVNCAIWHPALLVLAAEGLLIAAFLVLADAPAAVGGSVRLAGWLRGEARYAAAALAVTIVLTAALLIRPPVSAWLVLLGLCAVLAAYLAALPLGRRR